MANDKINYAEEARAKKVAAFVAYFDRSFPDRDAGDMASDLRDRTSAEEWSKHAILAGQRPPGATTVAMIIGEYERRAEYPAPNNAPVRKYAGVN